MKRKGCIGFFSWGSPGSLLWCLSFDFQSDHDSLRVPPIHDSRSEAEIPKVWVFLPPSSIRICDTLYKHWRFFFALLETITYPLQSPALSHRWFFSCSRLMGYVMLVPWRVDHDPAPCLVDELTLDTGLSNLKWLLSTFRWIETWKKCALLPVAITG